MMDEYRRPGDQMPFTEETAPEGSEEILVEIEQTRVEMSGTIDALQERLNPDRLKEQVTEAVQEQIAAAKEHMTDAVQEQVEMVKGNIHDATIGRAEEMVSNVGKSGLVETIKQNPIPAALAGLGIGWLLMNRQQGASGDRGGGSGRAYYAGGGQPFDGRGQSYRAGSYGYGQEPGYGRGQAYYGAGQQGDDQSLGDRVGGVAGQAKDKVGDVTGQAKDTVTDAASQAKDRVGQFTGQAQDQVGEWGGQVQYGAQQAKSRFDQTLHENPLAVSAAVVALGLAVGLSLPDTSLEDKLMGEARDNVMEKAQSTAQETMQKVGQVAQQVQQTATDTAKDAAQKQGLTGSPPQGNQQSGAKQPQSGTQQASATQPQSGTQPGGMQNMPKPQSPQPAQPPTAR
ncbi:MAG: DUF3618 domain-containing protein [Chloroflexota bacterium]|nr:DUF3618 domain-containing protein [Chloroflexota bacterium]